MNGEFLFLLEFPIGVRSFAGEFASLGANFFYQSTYNLDQIGNWQLKKITSLLSLHKNENRLELYGLLFTVFALLFWLCVCLALLFFISVGWQGQWPLPFFFFF